MDYLNQFKATFEITTKNRDAGILYAIKSRFLHRKKLTSDAGTHSTEETKFWARHGHFLQCEAKLSLEVAGRMSRFNQTCRNRRCVKNYPFRNGVSSVIDNCDRNKRLTRQHFLKFKWNKWSKRLRIEKNGILHTNEVPDLPNSNEVWCVCRFRIISNYISTYKKRAHLYISPSYIHHIRF